MAGQVKMPVLKVVGTLKIGFGTMATDSSLKGAPRTHAATGYGIVQLCLNHEYGEHGTVPTTWRMPEKHSNM